MDLKADDCLQQTLVSKFDLPAKRISRNDVYLWSPPCGIGWRCGISISNNQSYFNGNYLYRVQICLDLSCIDTSLESLSIDVDITYPANNYKEKFVQDYHPDLATNPKPSWSPSRGWSSGAIEFSISATYSRPTPSINQLKISRDLKESLHSSVSTATFVDTALFAFSRRRHGGRVDTPVPTYASSSILIKHSSYFEDMLSKSFLESKRGPLIAAFPTDQQSYMDDYYYDSDSDLSDTDDDVDCKQGGLRTEDRLDTGVSGSSTDSEDVKRSCSDKHALDDSGYHSQELPGADSQDKVGEGRTIVMRDVASKTLKAAVYYLYTGDIEFAALRSVKAAPVVTPAGMPAEGEDTASSATTSTPEPAAPIQLNYTKKEKRAQKKRLAKLKTVLGKQASLDQLYPCSPKSLYRFADMLELYELRQRAFEAIKSNLSKENIVEEVFTKFTSQYPEVLEMETQLLYTMRGEKEVQDALSAIMQRVPAGGEFSHAGDVLSKLFLKMARSGR
ncbi:hypothetical protein NEOLEDRAFT_1245679 [Neolentinus lepideus HHB14362 ss-1]|uniref:BTB domain-containing protein n=1 Tax=Neolentinus lepideus HHB14362 ss-1 TaxID=1314782 RepID=A0A165NIN4_9AGAM|nr:hypothetical protein NEOLEDRAFT_1245679 [Neolentinus lepideus HHB14362 ss-1]